MPPLEFDQHVDVAVGTEVVAEDRTEERQFPNVVTAAETSEICASVGGMFLGSSGAPLSTRRTRLCGTPVRQPSFCHTGRVYTSGDAGGVHFFASGSRFRPGGTGEIDANHRRPAGRLANRES